MGAFYRVASSAFLAAFRAFDVDIQVRGAANIPTTGGAILASNHISYLDFAFVMLASPAPRREVRFLARSEFFRVPLVGQALRALRQIPVDVQGDPLTAATKAKKALINGELVGLHPEGTISPSFVLRRGKSGAVRLAEQANVPLVPIGIWGAQRLLTKARPFRPRRHVSVLIEYGEPFYPTGRTGAAKTAELMERINQLVLSAQQRYPQQATPTYNWWLPAHLGGTAPTTAQADAMIAEQFSTRHKLDRP